MKNKKNEKGITLIALIITIIVMLILVAVTVRTAINSGLFGHASDATKRWGDAQEKEGNIGNGKITIDGTEYNSMDEYVSSISKNNTYMLAFSNGEEYILREYFFMVTENKDYQLTGTTVDDYENCYFRNYLDLYVKETDGNRKVFDNNVKKGALCDNYGNYIMGYIVDETTGNLDKDTLKSIYINTEEDTQRKGTRIDEKGNIYAIYEDETEKIIAQTPIVAIQNPAGLGISKTRTEVYKGMPGSGEGYIQDLDNNEDFKIKNIIENAEKEMIRNTKVVNTNITFSELVVDNISQIRFYLPYFYDSTNYGYTAIFNHEEKKFACVSAIITNQGVVNSKYLTEQEFENFKKEYNLSDKFGSSYTYMTEQEFDNMKR